MNNLYIASTSRSGSTLLAEYLCQMENLVSLGELMYWSLEDYNSKPCTCGFQNCQYLRNLGKNINLKCTDLLLHYWQEYEAHLFGDYKNEELYERDTSDREMDLNKAYAQILNTYKRVFGEQSIFIDNSKNINVLTDLLKEDRKLFKGIVLTLNPSGILNSYIKSGIRKSKKRSIVMKLKEIQYFLKKSRYLIENTGNRVIHIKYEDFLNDPTNTGKHILDFLDYNKNRVGSVLETTFSKTSHLIKGNHFMYTPGRYIQINATETESDTSRITADFLDIINEDYELRELLQYFGYKYE